MAAKRRAWRAALFFTLPIRRERPAREKRLPPLFDLEADPTVPGVGSAMVEESLRDRRGNATQTEPPFRQSTRAQIAQIGAGPIQFSMATRFNASSVVRPHLGNM